MVCSQHSDRSGQSVQPPDSAVETNQALSNSNKGASNPIPNQSKLSTEETAGKQTKTVLFASDRPVENEPTTVQMTNMVDHDVGG